MGFRVLGSGSKDLSFWAQGCCLEDLGWFRVEVSVL